MLLHLPPAKPIITFLFGFYHLTSVYAAASPPTVTLPPLLGPYNVGTKRVEVTDHNRPDPWLPTNPRTLVLQLFYPIHSRDGLIPAPWLPPNASALTDQMAELPSGTVSSIQTRIFTDGSAIFPLEKHGELPVIVYSPGFASVPASATSILSSLASFGYTIIAIGHTFESFPLEGLNGEVILPLLTQDDFERVLPVRISDVDFISRQLTFSQLRAWLPDDESDFRTKQRRTQGKKKQLTLGIMGTSFGGNTAASAMRDPKSLYRASASLDGLFLNDTSNPGHSFRGPLLYIAATTSCCTDSLTLTWPTVTPWKLAIEINGTVHMSFSDMVSLKPQLPSWKFPSESPPNVNLSEVGTINDRRMNEIVVVYLKEFWEWTLLGKGKGALLKKESKRFPDVTFLDLD